MSWSYILCGVCCIFYPFPGLATSNKRVSVPCWGHNPAYKRTRRTCLLYISKHCKLTIFVHFAFVACCCSHRNRLLESVTSGSAEFKKQVCLQTSFECILLPDIISILLCNEIRRLTFALGREFCIANKLWARALFCCLVQNEQWLISWPVNKLPAQRNVLQAYFLNRRHFFFGMFWNMLWFGALQDLHATKTTPVLIHMQIVDRLTTTPR